MNHRTRVRPRLGNGAVNLNGAGSNGGRPLNNLDTAVLSTRQTLGPQCKGDLGNIISTKSLNTIIRCHLGLPAIMVDNRSLISLASLFHSVVVPLLWAFCLIITRNTLLQFLNCGVTR